MGELEKYQEHVINALNKLFECFCEASGYAEDVFKQVYKIINSANKKISEREAERKKWRIYKCEKIRSLFLDKRSKIHRCRNAC